jgi:hypothetical protein
MAIRGKSSWDAKNMLVTRNWSIFREWHSGIEGELSQKLKLDRCFLKTNDPLRTLGALLTIIGVVTALYASSILGWFNNLFCDIRHSTLARVINQTPTSTKCLYTLHLTSLPSSTYWPPGSVGTRLSKVRGLMQPVTIRSTSIRPESYPAVVYGIKHTLRKASPSYIPTLEGNFGPEVWGHQHLRLRLRTSRVTTRPYI